MHDHNHHHHEHETTSPVNALWTAFILNFAFLVLEVVVGIMTNSLVLLSDAGHMVSDVAALALALFTERLVEKKPGGAFTFGYRRAPVLGAFGNALTLYIIVVLIFREAWDRIISPPDVSGLPVLLVGIAGLLVNAISAFWLYKSHDHSLNIRGALLHLVADALGSIGAIIAAIVMMTSHWSIIDPLISIGIGFLILFGTWPLLRDSIKVLLQAAPQKVTVSDVRQLLVADPHVDHLEDLHIWEINTGDSVFMATLVVKDPSITLASVQKASDNLRALLSEKYGIKHVTLEWRTTGGAINGCEHSCE